MWIVTREINEYDQDGAYFVAAFYQKPTVSQLTSLKGELITDAVAQYMINHGGGRHGTEYEWFYLEEYGAGCTSPETQESN